MALKPSDLNKIGHKYWIRFWIRIKPNMKNIDADPSTYRNVPTSESSNAGFLGVLNAFVGDAGSSWSDDSSDDITIDLDFVLGTILGDSDPELSHSMTGLFFLAPGFLTLGFLSFGLVPTSVRVLLTDFWRMRSRRLSSGEVRPELLLSSSSSLSGTINSSSADWTFKRDKPKIIIFVYQSLLLN